MMVSALYAGYPQDAFATVNEVQAVMQSNPVKGQVVDENGDPIIGATVINPEKPDVPLNKNDAFQKVQKRRVQEKR